MSALHLVHPEWLTALVAALALLGAALGLAHVSARRRLRRLLPGGGRVVRPVLRSDLALFGAALALAVAALGPRIGDRVVKVPASGVDVVFAVDVSRSMDAQDVPPSRLDRARRAVDELLARLEPRDRTGLAAFAGGGVLIAPLTPDRAVLSELLSGLDTELIRPRSSDLAAGVRAAVEAFESGSERPRLLVLLTDGEDPERRGDLGAAVAARAGARVFAIALGSEAGATVPDHGVPLVDAGGNTVVSRRNADRLEALVAATGGEVWRADRWGAVDFDALREALRRDAGTTPGALVERKVRAVRVVPFVAFAFVLLLVEGLPRPRASGVSGPAPAPVVVASVVLLLAAPSPAGDAALDTLAALEQQVRERPDDPAALVALGAGRLERGRRDAAARAFLAAALLARDPKAASVAYFDLGVAELERQDLEAARRAFLDALAMNPKDERARYNLEWTLLALAQQPPPEASPEAPPPPQTPTPLADRPEESEATDDPEGPGDVPPPPEAAPPEPMSEPQQRRLLERIEDDPGHALRAAARDARSDAPGGGVVW